MSALLNPVYRTKKAIKWGLVAYTVAIFLFLTIGSTIHRDILSVTYIDEREYGVAGPFEYLHVFDLSRDAMSLVPALTFPINQWLVDGLLVSFASTPVAQVSNVVDHHFSCIAVMLFIL